MKVSDPNFIIGQAVDVLAKRHGSLRAAARVLNLTPAYLCRLRQGVKTEPSETVLRKLGLRRVVRYEWRG